MKRYSTALSLFSFSLMVGLVVPTGCSTSDPGPFPIRFTLEHTMPDTRSVQTGRFSTGLDGLMLPSALGRLAAVAGTTSSSQFSFGAVTATLNGVSQVVAPGGPPISVADLSMLSQMTFERLVVTQSQPDTTYKMAPGTTDLAGDGLPAVLFSTGTDPSGGTASLGLTGIQHDGQGGITFAITTEVQGVATGSVQLAPGSAPTLPTLTGGINVTLTSSTLSPPFAVTGAMIPTSTDSFGTVIPGRLTLSVQPTGNFTATSVTFNGASAVPDSFGNVIFALANGPLPPITILATDTGGSAYSFGFEIGAVTGVVGSEGGSLTAGGVTLTIPAGSVSAATPFSIAVRADVPQGYSAASLVYEFGPSGATFSIPLEVSIPLEGNPTSPILYWSNATGGFEAIAATVSEGRLIGQVTHFSIGFAAVPDRPDRYPDPLPTLPPTLTPTPTPTPTPLPDPDPGQVPPIE